MAAAEPVALDQQCSMCGQGRTSKAEAEAKAAFAAKADSVAELEQQLALARALEAEQALPAAKAEAAMRAAAEQLVRPPTSLSTPSPDGSESS